MARLCIIGGLFLNRSKRILYVAQIDVSSAPPPPQKSSGFEALNRVAQKRRLDRKVKNRAKDAK
ncbi:MAG: hypothetical protein LBO72_10920 [Helicobacteraceae bacterium]|jgi:hypothetical protein|nr:hypothetical protein [Helicobacteraceae bacterium]